MKIKRDSLLQQMFEFCQTGHGVVIGKPGVGKTYLLKELKANLLDKGILSFIVRIDSTADASDDSIQTELGIDSFWINTLKEIRVKDSQKAVLFFDSFDAARDESLRNGFLTQIKKAKKELSDKWNIIVSVRTYDATKSPELIRLFPNTSGASSCRTFEVPVLTESELENLFKEDDSIKSVYSQCTEELKRILNIPYFIVLLKRVLVAENNEEVVTEIKLLKSETQLLSKYWDIKIVNTSDNSIKEKILVELTQLLLSKRTLTFSKGELIKNFGKEDSDAFSYLRSENILEEFTVGYRVGFSHNILFDYAVARLCIPSIYSDFVSFISSDTTRPFFFRPSFLYFFNQLWYEERKTFWEIYWELFKHNNKEIQLSLQLILNTTIASEYSDVSDLSEVVDHKDKAISGTIVKQLLQSITFLRHERPAPQDQKFVIYLSQHISVEFVWQLSYLLDRQIQKSPSVKELGLAARLIFSFVLENRNKKDINKISLDRLGSTRGITMVCQTYETDKEESKNLLRKVLNFLSEPNFDIWYFTTLTDQLGFITDHDPSFVATIYETIFTHKETSTAQTSMGTVALNLLSNRRQDFDMCYYRLEEYYPKYIISAPQWAIKVGLSAVTNYVIEDKYYSSKPQSEKFKIGEIDCEFMHDLSSMWHDTNDIPAQIGNHIITYFENLLNAGHDDRLKDYLPIYFENAKAAFCWKKILELGVKYPEQLKDLLFPLLTTEIILISGDTIYESAKLIEATAKLLNQKQVNEIEKTILKILEPDSDAAESNKRKVARLLNQIPLGLLQLDVSKEFVAATAVIPNEPTFRSSWSSEPVTNELWLKDRGVDVTEPVNSTLIDQTAILETFNNTWLNRTPGRTDCQEYFNCASSVFESLKTSGADKRITESALREVAKTFAIICRTINSLNPEEISIAGAAIIYCLNFETPDTVEIDEDASPAGGYSPTPRIEAAEALPFLVTVDTDGKFIAIYKDAANDRDPIVRFSTIRNLAIIKNKYPKEYWEVLYHRLENERDKFTASVVLSNTYLSQGESQELFNKALEIANKRKDLIGDRNSFTETFIELLLRSATTKNEVAERIIYENIDNQKFSVQLIYRIFHFVAPGSFNGGRDKAFGLKLFNDILKQSGIHLKNLKLTASDVKDENAKEALQLFDSAVQQIYFSLNLREGVQRRGRQAIDDDQRRNFYFDIKPSLKLILEIAQETTSEGLIIAHTAYHFSQIINGILTYDPKDALSMAAQVTRYSYKTGYTFDSSAIEQIINLTEKILADHRALLLEKESFDNLIEVLDYYVNSGWTSALELLWKLDDVFR